MFFNPYFNPYLVKLFGFMPLWLFITIIVVLVLVVLLVILYRYGTKLQKKQADAQEQINSSSQTVSMLIIDKKRLKLKESGLPQAVINETPKYLRNSKLPIVKAKVGPQILNMICDEKIFDQVPTKKEVKASVSGIYITGIKGLRGGLEAKPEKVGFMKRLRKKMIDKNNEAMDKIAKIEKEEAASNKAKSSKKKSKKSSK